MGEDKEDKIERAEIGDVVNVYFASCQSELDVTLKFLPSEIGDCLIVKRRNDKIVYIHSYEKMVVVAKKKS